MIGQRPGMDAAGGGHQHIAAVEAEPGHRRADAGAGGLDPAQRRAERNVLGRRQVR